MKTKNFNFYIPLQKQKNNEDVLVGVASTLSVDKDSEKMSENALRDMENKINNVGVNLFGNHEHNWENTLGFINEAKLSGDTLKIKMVLDDPETNEKVRALKNKLSRGINLGLSVGGAVTKEKWDYDKEMNKKVKVIDGVELYEISVVGIPSNADAFVSLPTAIAKCRKEKCPVCFSSMNKKCNVCLWRN